MIDVFLIFLRLGLTSFGGPVAHIGYFRQAFVARRGWVDDGAYAGIVGFCQMLPGPSSSQVAMVLGHHRAGYAGLIAAWVGFTLPSALMMAALGFVLTGAAPAPLLHGLKIAAAAVVAQALWSMAKSLTPDLPRAALAAAAMACALMLPTALGQVVAIGAAAVIGWLWLTPAPAGVVAPGDVPRHAAVWLMLFLALLLGLPLLAGLDHRLALFGAFYRSGALVFGGGHVVLPLLQAAVVAPGWIGAGTFMGGYGAAQAMPGPLFSFAAFLGAAMAGWGGALLCLVAIYLPSLLLVAGGWPLWRAVAHRPPLRAALAGINAAVVGLLAAAFCTPVLTGAILGWGDAVLALAALGLLLAAVPSWAVVGLCALAGLWLH